MDKIKNAVITGLVFSSILCLCGVIRSRNELNQLKQDCENEFERQHGLNDKNLDLHKAHDRELRLILDILKVRDDSN